MSQSIEVIGNFTDAPSLGDQEEFLSLQFNPTSIPLKERWRNNGLSADFMADYVTTFFPRVEDKPETSERQAEIKSAVSYIANELLENGMKYSNTEDSHPISISLYLLEHAILISEVNLATEMQAAAYKAFILKLRESDPMDMYMEQLEAKAMDYASSGLGFLTMINDYMAELAWKFATDSQGRMVVTTEVTIPT
jgi:hypothetical protein